MNSVRLTFLRTISSQLFVLLLVSIGFHNFPANAQDGSKPEAAPIVQPDTKPSLIEAKPAAQSLTKNYWIFLTTGQPKAEFSRDEVEKMQAAHLANFGRLFKLGKLSAAGPISDPERKLRGIVCATAADLGELTGYFAEDPFVENGLLKIEAHEIVDQQGAFGVNPSETEMEEFQVVMLYLTSPSVAGVNDKTATATQDYLTTILQPDKMRLALRFQPNDNHLAGILIMKKQETAATEALIKKIPLISSGLWKHQVLPLFMSQGILDDQSE